MKWFRRQGEMRDSAQDVLGLSGLAQSHGGIHPIPVDLIVGSAGRAHELKPNFMPILYPHGDARFQRVMARIEEGGSLPPIEVYRYAHRYYVVDGHHRVAAARKLGQVEIDAVITDVRSTGPVNHESAAA